MKRLFDIVEQNAKQYPEEVIFGYKENGNWKKILYKDAFFQIQNVATSLLNIMGLPSSYDEHHQHKIAIISENRPEWLLLDLAIQEASAIITPIYPTVSNDDLKYILEEANIKYIFVSNNDIYNRFKKVIANDSFKVFSFDQIEGVENWESLNVQHSSEELLNLSKENITEDTVATIIYTSGTTGRPKGVILTHKNIYSNVKVCAPIFHMAKPWEKSLSFLPLNHIFEKMVSYIYLKINLSIYYAESLETIGDNLREVQPVVFTCVPRVLEKVYEKIVAKGKELTGIKKKLFFWALNLAKKYDNHKDMGIIYNLQLKLANKLIFSKWREALGNKVIAIISGSAALNPDLIRIFTAANIVIMEGYGLTETSPVIAVNRYENDGRYFGTVGPLVDDVKVKIAPDGEILCSGPNVMKGYYKNDKETESVFTEDGWFMTGDIGEFVQDKFLKITDRKKEIFKTSGGKYVAPQYIENMYRNCDTINQVMVVGNGKKYVGALVVPNWEYIAKQLNNNNPYTQSERNKLIHDEELRRFILKDMETVNNKINHVEQVKQIALIADEWTVDNGILTPKMSLKRKVAEHQFEKEINRIYEHS